jgi:hypothetical protein
VKEEEEEEEEEEKKKKKKKKKKKTALTRRKAEGKDDSRKRRHDSPSHILYQRRLSRVNLSQHDELESRRGYVLGKVLQIIHHGLQFRSVFFWKCEKVKPEQALKKKKRSN